MNKGTVMISYLLAALSGVCFAAGMAVLSGGKA